MNRAPNITCLEAIPMRESLFAFVLIATMGVHGGLLETPIAGIFAAQSSLAINQPLASPFVQKGDAKTALERAQGLVNEIKAAAYPELRGADVQAQLFKSESDYFRARFAIGQFITGRKMRYIVFVNPDVFTRQAPQAGVRAIIAHELAHILYFSQ